MPAVSSVWIDEAAPIDIDAWERLPAGRLVARQSDAGAIHSTPADALPSGVINYIEHALSLLNGVNQPISREDSRDLANAISLLGTAKARAEVAMQEAGELPCVSCEKPSDTSTPGGAEMCWKCFGEFNAAVYDQLRIAAQALSAKLHACMPATDGAFAMIANHGGRYDRPTFGEDLKALDATLGLGGAS